MKKYIQSSLSFSFLLIQTVTDLVPHQSRNMFKCLYKHIYISEKLYYKDYFQVNITMLGLPVIKLF